MSRYTEKEMNEMEDRFDMFYKIYKDFEDKICKNCKYYDKDGFCLNDWYKEKNTVNGDLLGVQEAFGCNKFEEIEND